MIAFQALFAKGSSGELGRVAGAMVLVYGTAWAVIGWRFGQTVLGAGSGGSSAAPPVDRPAAPTAAAPSAAPPPAASPPAAGGLPALGGGAFPPIEPPKS